MTEPVLILLGSAMILGLYLVYLGIRHHKGSSKLGLTHGALAVTGTSLLLTEIFTGATDKMNNLAALFLVLAILGGGLVFALREPGKSPSMPIVVTHAIMGLIGAGILASKLL